MNSPRYAIDRTEAVLRAGLYCKRNMSRRVVSGSKADLAHIFKLSQEQAKQNLILRAQERPLLDLSDFWRRPAFVVAPLSPDSRAPAGLLRRLAGRFFASWRQS